VGSAGVEEYGEFYIVILGIPGRSCMFFLSESMGNRRSKILDAPDDIQEVGLTHSSIEASNDCGAKGLA
jgi:hypothetical protein